MTAYRTLDPEGVKRFLAARRELAERLGGEAQDWTVREVSDGNLNLVFLVFGTTGRLCVKQSLPHVRVDPDWKMPLDRTAFEAAWLRRIEPLVPGLTPAFLDFDPEQFVLTMECLDGFVTLREALTNGADPIAPSRILGGFVARSAFLTSYLAQPFEAVTPDLAFFSGNTTLTRITVDLVLTDPYREHPRNHWLPALDADVAAMRSDPQIIARIGALQERFLTTPQALLHGDLHSGSIMIADHDVRVIDGEFSLYGPIGFDCGLYLAHLALAHAATTDAPRKESLAAAIKAFWRTFCVDFLHLWKTQAHGADLYVPTTFSNALHELDALRTRFINGVFHDAVGFAAAEIVRRLIGYAQTSDFDHIQGQQSKADRQRVALSFACALLRDAPADIDAFTEMLHPQANLRITTLPETT
ncbi:methylthioribose kinase [Acetobacter nitrogenifigens DSM 23921 = NBRC 105050]|uniref:S-methyl-5-thioribose kinase n=1 Tax=Acetobacter nitrogenifigens DSM 23921 = NBRC 105050 TaxID=1120919 RepID=A0A511XCM2_9PROT|nr:S-methyl-5-thioribose kinase [Acetobacter nitrogenifigens]GBQ87841.1 methylthioribose kinase [Acetobacter nitrogenifigens DSM 23921 = NBRC 105050]GEN60716.1 methylthioribose kinase [Acetobacter nitrogenifigens DSM 23921 = NBRC 105050]